ncbi:DUF4019 domain-containing protein [Dyella japonica]|uniref:DUF4019 domain-containing protein n=1 Tax=Dyella japonica A8 TaxID=1217721 RepID=A0A075K2N6_9GAMM|nr:DUF4019 domain-containing protein [Dyella japonica]AIF48484.1 hypothetical protein HY57_15205 [Dyella japonica A8]
MINKRFPCALLLLVSVAAPAQVASVRPPAVRAAQADLDPGHFVDAAFKALAAVESGQAGLVWDMASPVMKSATTRVAFIDSEAMHASANGQLATRQWFSINRNRIDGNSGDKHIPPGSYLTVLFVGSNKAGQTLQQNVTFALDSDGIWRLAGIVL